MERKITDSSRDLCRLESRFPSFRDLMVSLSLKLRMIMLEFTEKRADCLFFNSSYFFTHQLRNLFRSSRPEDILSAEQIYDMIYTKFQSIGSDKETIVLSYTYLIIFLDVANIPLFNANLTEVIVIAMLVAQKISNANSHSYLPFARVLENYQLCDVVLMERKFLKCLNFDLNFTLEKYDDNLRSLLRLPKASSIEHEKVPKLIKRAKFLSKGDNKLAVESLVRSKRAASIDLNALDSHD